MNAPMPAETLPPYESRERIAEAFAQWCGSSSAGQSYFYTAFEPCLLPEKIPSDLPSNVFWIGQKARDAVYQNYQAIGDMLLRMVDYGDLSAEDAVICSELFDLTEFKDDATVLSLLPKLKLAAAQNIPKDLPDTPTTVSVLVPTDPYLLEKVPLPLAEIIAFPDRPTSTIVDAGVTASITELFPETLGTMYDFTPNTQQVL